MRTSGACPKCGGRKLYVVEPATVTDPQSSNGREAMVVASALFVGGEGFIRGEGFFGGKMERVGAEVDAWVCAACGLTELHARDVRVLADMVEQGLGNVRVVGH